MPICMQGPPPKLTVSGPAGGCQSLTKISAGCCSENDRVNRQSLVAVVALRIAVLGHCLAAPTLPAAAEASARTETALPPPRQVLERPPQQRAESRGSYSTAFAFQALTVASISRVESFSRWARKTSDRGPLRPVLAALGTAPHIPLCPLPLPFAFPLPFSLRNPFALTFPATVA